MNKQEFLDLAARLYDAMAEPQLFAGSEEKTIEVPMVEAAPAAERITTYKPRVRKNSDEPLRLDNISAHYGQNLGELVRICSECGVRVQLINSHRYIDRRDIPFLTAFVERKYNNFNKS